MRRFLVCLVALLVMGMAPPAHASNDPFFNEQWSLARMNVPAAWTVSTGAGVTVGVVDSGVQTSHPDLAGRIVASTSCINGNPCAGSGEDTNGHGTHVSGIIAANKDNGQGVAGVAPSAQLVVARVFNDGDSTSDTDIKAGAAWAVSHGARIVNFSLGETGVLGTGLFNSHKIMRDASVAVWQAGAIPVIAAGNGGCASWSGTEGVVVGATGPSDETASYSCSPASALRGVTAPGGNSGDCENNPAPCVLSTWKGSQYAYVEGTSMAAPAVSGALALLLGQGLSREAALDRLMSTLDGSRVNVSRAVCGASCPAASLPSGGTTAGTGGNKVAPTTRVTTPRPRTVPAITSPTTVAPVTTTTEAVTTTTEPPTTTTGQVALAQRQASDDSRAPIAAGLLALAGLVAAIAGTVRQWIQSRRNTVTTLP